MKNKFYKPVIIFVLAFLISLPVILPYFHSGYFPTHDGEWAVVRLGDMFRSLRDHQFPVRYSGNLNFGYGYPLFNFTYPAPYYLGTVLHFLKFGFVDSIKFLFAISVLISAITMYLLSSEIWKNKIAGIVSAIFYIYLPYRIVDLYARGSIGESLSFALFPFILFCAIKILDEKITKKYIVLGALSYALLITTHNIMAVLFTPVLLVLMATKMYISKNKLYLESLLFFILSYTLSAFFWLPALLEKNNISLSLIPIANRDIYFVRLDQLIIPKWGYGLPDGPNGFTYQIGIAHIIVFLTILIFVVQSKIKKQKISKDFRFLFATVTVGMTFVLVLLMFPFTKEIWKLTPLLREINYPWTLLAPVGFLISLLSGFLVVQKSYLKYFAFALCGLAFTLTVSHAKPELFFDKGDGYYLTNDATTTSSDELMPVWVKQKPTQKTDKKVVIIKGNGSINNIITNSKKLEFNTDLKTNSVIEVNIIYYPGWNASIDGKPTSIFYSNPKALMRINIPSGNHQVVFKFTETTSRLISDLLSLASLIIVLIFTVYLFFKKNK